MATGRFLRNCFANKLRLALAASYTVCAHPAFAQITFDFLPDGTGYISSFGTPFLLQDVQVSTGFGTQTIQLPEIISIGGVSYYHLVVGDPNTEFVQEVYIQRGFIGYSNGQVGSASAGSSNNHINPLNDITSGSATGNPNRVMIKQVVKDSDITMTFTKDTLNLKPVITQDITTSDIKVFTEIDMSNSTYSDSSTAGAITNTVKLLSNNPGALGDFDMDADKQNSNVTAGRYIYTTGTGPGGSAGTYTYADGGFNAVGWEAFVEDRPGNWTDPNF